MFFCCSPCPGAVQYCRCDNSVKEMKPVSVEVRLGCQFLSMSGERGPSTTDSVLYLSTFLIHQCDHLSQIFDCSFKRKYFEMYHPFKLFLRVRHDKNVVSKSLVGYAISFLVSQFDVQALFVPSTNVLLHC